MTGWRACAIIGGSDYRADGRIDLRSNKSTGWLLAAVAFTIAAILSWWDLGFVLTSDGSEGVTGMSAATAVLFTIAAVGCYIQWNRIRRKPEE